MKKSGGVIREWAGAFLWALLIVLLLRVLLLEAFTIPSTSMQSTLLPGDFIMVSKFHYGARVPVTPLTFPFAHQKIPFTDRKGYSDAIQIPYLRIPGLSEPATGDVLVFNNPAEKEHPVDHRTHYVKRCIGLPGDTVRITHGMVMVNGEPLKIPETLMAKYHLKTDTSLFDPQVLSDMGISDWQRISNVGDFESPLTAEMAEQLKSVQGVQSIRQSLSSPSSDKYVYPFHDSFPWTIDFYGPLYVPARGDSILLDAASFRLYKDVILHEKKHVSVSGDSILTDHKPATWYTFNENYYFVLGDNRYFSADSRYWGFVPESHLVGKAWFVLFSVNRMPGYGTGEIRTDRFFKGIE